MSTYHAKRYLSYKEIAAFCSQIVQENSDWMSLKIIGTTPQGRDILQILIGKNPKTTPILWLDAGTHASEWTGVMACLFALSEWTKELHTPEGQHWFENNSIAIPHAIRT